MDAPALPDQLTMHPGATTVLEAPGHGIGGYLWTASVDEGPGRIEPRAAPPAAPQSEPGIGAGSTARFTLTWLGAEPGLVTLELKRPWESAPVATHRIRIVADA